MFRKNFLFWNLVFLSFTLFLSSDLLNFAQASEKIWSEKGRKAKDLVSLPSLDPIIRDLDATVVNVSSSAEVKKDENPNRRMPLEPFSMPEEFFERFFGNPQMPRRSSGSGFIISKDGYIITNNHVIDGADKVEVALNVMKRNESTKETFTAKIVGRDPRTDIALIKIEVKRDLPFAYLGQSADLKKGDWVVAIGNPFGLDRSVSLGIVSALGREISPNENRRFDDFIQTDAAINFGNSGGPLVNLKGEVIGINTAISAQGSGIGFAVPIDLVKEILPQLKEKGSVQRGFLGVMIQDVTPEVQDALGLKEAAGVLVNDIVPQGPATKADLKPGDVIVEIENQKTPDARTLQRIVGNRAPGEKINLKVLRDGKISKKIVTLGELDEGTKAPKPSKNEQTDLLGLNVEDSKDGGLEVVDVSPESAAFEGGIMPGDRILQITYKSERYSMDSLKDYQKLLSKLQAGNSILFTIQRPQGPQSVQLYIAFRVPKKDK
ncbi:MAG: trypsin-like peptidase domain-containing protein [Bdellovibrionota bacterium]